MKIVKNCCYGGFGLSDEACEWLINNKGWKVTNYKANSNTLEDTQAQLILTDKPEIYGKYWQVYNNEQLRINQDVIECVETLGEKANGVCAELEIVEIPDDIEWEIEEYDGIETIHEVHRTW